MIMAIVFYISAILTAIGVMMCSWGYNLRLPYYSRHKLLSGVPFQSQWKQRTLTGEALIKVGVCVLALSILIGFGIVGMLVPDRSEYFAPATVEVHQIGSYTLLIINDKEHRVDRNIYYWIDDTYPGITMRNRYSMYGWKLHSDELILIDILPEEDERFLEIDNE